MDLKKIAPWNWFKDEENEHTAQMPVSSDGKVEVSANPSNSVNLLHRDMNDLFSRFLHGYGITAPGMEKFFQGSLADGLLRPMVDINASDKDYSITIEIPGIEHEDVKLEISNNILTVRGEKRQKKEDKNKNYYRMERSYGAFQRTLSLPEDADQDNVNASFTNGVLTIVMPRKVVPRKETKQIQIQ